MEWVGNSEMTSCGDTTSNTASDSEISDDNLTGNNSEKDNNTIPHVSINNLSCLPKYFYLFLIWNSWLKYHYFIPG